MQATLRNENVSTKSEPLKAEVKFSRVVLELASTSVLESSCQNVAWESTRDWEPKTRRVSQ